MRKEPRGAAACNKEKEVIWGPEMSPEGVKVAGSQNTELDSGLKELEASSSFSDNCLWPHMMLHFSWREPRI